MKRFLPLLLIAVLAAALSTGCKQKEEKPSVLVALATASNAKGEQEVKHDMILEKCIFNEGDSVFTYQMKLLSKRFNKLSDDELKENIAATLYEGDMQTLLKAFVQENVQLKYEYSLPNGTTKTAQFTVDALKALIK